MALGITPQEIVAKEEYQLLTKAGHWLRVPLSDVVNVQNGFAFKSSFFDRNEGLPLIRIRDICKTNTEHRYKGEYKTEYVVTKGDILIGMDGDFTAAIWQGPNALLNQRVCRLSLSSHYFDQRFLFLCLQPYLNAINAETSSVTVKHLSSKAIGDIPLPLPPLNEQKRIVGKIEELFSELDNGISALKTAREQLKVYRQAVLKHAFEGKLTAQWRAENQDKLESPEQLLTRIQQEREARYQQQLEKWKTAVKEWEAKGREGKKPAKPKVLKNYGSLPDDILEQLLALPDSWFWGKLAFITTGVEYGTSAKSAEIGAVPVIRMGNLQNGNIDWSSLVYTSDPEEIEKYLLKKDDVLFNRTNSPELVGKSAKYKGERPALFAGYLIRINQIGAIALPDYVNYFLNSHFAKQYGNSVKTDGVNQSNINGEKLQNYPFPFCSIAEQTVIVEILEEKLSLTDASIRDIELQLAKAETLRQSILKKAFSGQLVPQDPNDEPASELLARIKAEKEAQKAAEKAQQAAGKKPAAKRGRKLREPVQ